MIPSRPHSRRILVGVALASAVFLTGCDAAPDFRPGVAAQVGGDTISLHQVDDVSASFCDYVETQLQSGQVLANHYVRGQVAGALALRAAADQFAAEQGVSADASYDAAVKQAEQSLAKLPQDQVQAVIDVQGVNTYVQAVEKAAGAKLDPSGAADAQTAAGQKAFRTWLKDHDVSVDPRFGVSIDKGSTAAVDTSLSFGLSDTATKADAAQPDTDYAGDLPATQRCG